LNTGWRDDKNGSGVGFLPMRLVLALIAPACGNIQLILFRSDPTFL
jgi:hypothetical protein